MTDDDYHPWGEGGDIMPCSLVDGYKHLGGIGYVHIQDIEAHRVTRRQ